MAVSGILARLAFYFLSIVYVHFRMREMGAIASFRQGPSIYQVACHHERSIIANQCPKVRLLHGGLNKRICRFQTAYFFLCLHLRNPNLSLSLLQAWGRPMACIQFVACVAKRALLLPSPAEREGALDALKRYLAVKGIESEDRIVQEAWGLDEEDWDN